MMADNFSQNFLCTEGRGRWTTQRGITLIQIAIGLIVLGLFTAAAITAYRVSLYQENEKVTQERLDKIKVAMRAFLQKEQHAACPADETAAIDSDTYGVEQLFGVSGATVCESGLTTSFGVLTGAVPVRSLNLSDDYMYDGWGRLFTYAVTQDLAATEARYDTGNGKIRIERADRSVATDEAMYTVISHGPDGRGGLAPNGQPYQACIDTHLDGENCDSDDPASEPLTFRLGTALDSTTSDEISFYSRADGPNYYDDMMVYGLKQPIVLPVVKDYSFETFGCNVGEGGIEDNISPVGTLEPRNCATLSFSAAHDRIICKKDPEDPEEDPQSCGIGIGYAPTDPSLITTRGRLLYSGTREASSNGKVLIRATIPIRYDNDLASVLPIDTADAQALYNRKRILRFGDTSDPAYQDGYDHLLTRTYNLPSDIYDTRPYHTQWELAVHAAIYVDGVRKVIGDVINPVSFYGPEIGSPTYLTDSAGGSGSVIAQVDEIKAGETYTVDIYLFTTHYFEDTPVRKREIVCLPGRTPECQSEVVTKLAPAIRNVSAWAGTIRHGDYHADGYVEFMELGAF